MFPEMGGYGACGYPSSHAPHFSPSSNRPPATCTVRFAMVALEPAVQVAVRIKPPLLATIAAALWCQFHEPVALGRSVPYNFDELHVTTQLVQEKLRLAQTVHAKQIEGLGSLWKRIQGASLEFHPENVADRIRSRLAHASGCTLRQTSQSCRLFPHTT